MNKDQLFREVVRLAHWYVNRDDPTTDNILNEIEHSLRIIRQFPVLDDGRYLMVRLPLEEVTRGADGSEDAYQFFRVWLADNTRARVVALYDATLRDVLFFFEDVSDATLFKLKWC